MTTLSIDIETFSSTDLTKSGVYKYVEAPDFAILIFAYSFDNNPVQIIDLAQGEELPEDIKNSLLNPSIIKKAYNALFERTCIARYYGLILPADQWDCTMVKASMLGLPLGLDFVSRVLKLKAEKATNGKALIRYFSIPCKPTKTNGERLRNLPEHNPEKWNEFKEYCRQDVVVEQAVGAKIAFFEIPVMEKKLWALDQKINDHGVLLNPSFVRNAITLGRSYREKLVSEITTLTQLENPNSAIQLKEWISTETGTDVTSLTKEEVPLLMEQTDSSEVKRVLEIRQEMSRTSVKKYEAMLKYVCHDDRVRGLLQFYGANRTGRWAGRGIQLHNLPQNHLPDLDLARELVKEGNGEILELLFGNVPDTLSQLIRTAFIAPVGYELIITDFSAIESRIVAWLAGEKWRMDVFATHGKIYEASAAAMFRVPITEVTKGSALRQKGKVAELALGYQGGPNALVSMGALKMGIAEEELPKLVAMWRNANKAICRYWETVNAASLDTLRERTPIIIGHGVGFMVEKGIFYIRLPSGRRLAYLKPKIKVNRFGNDAITYEGMDQTTKQWGTQETYGGKLVENIVQAIARDCLADAMLRLDKAGYTICMHVHDEIVMEVPKDKGVVEEVNKIMSEPITWAKGLPLQADSHKSFYYKKD